MALFHYREKGQNGAASSRDVQPSLVGLTAPCSTAASVALLPSDSDDAAWCSCLAAAVLSRRSDMKIRSTSSSVRPRVSGQQK